MSENTPDNPHQQFLYENRISWYFIPARSPHHGGLWESAIKSFKSHFKRVIGDTILTLEQMLTVITQIECILNSRPLVPLSSSDPSDLQVLTPGHFLIGRDLLTIPQTDVTDVAFHKLKSYKQLQQLVTGYS